MEILIVLGTLLVCFALGVPIAYALGLGALAGAYWIGIPLKAVMLQVSSGVSKFCDADDPVLCAGRRGRARDLAVLRGDVLRADAGHLHPVCLIMVAADARIVRCTQFVVNLVDLELLFW